MKKDLPFFTPGEVALHNKPNDIWVSIWGKVFDLTSVVKEHKGEKCVDTLMAFAGKDMSHMFDKCTGEIVTGVHPVTLVRVPMLAHAPLPDMSVPKPTTRWKPPKRLPWWKRDSLVVGYLTTRARPLRIVNMLTFQEHSLMVCNEETVDVILKKRERLWNSHVKSYTCKFEGRVLDLDKTLEENGIPDDRDKFVEVGLPADTYVPCLGLYFNDDLTPHNYDRSAETPPWTPSASYLV